MAVLQATVVDTDYMAQNYKDLPDVTEESNCEKITREHKAGTAKQAILDDDGFWVDLDAHLAAIKPMYKFLRRHDSSAPTIGKVYSGWFELIEALKEVPQEYSEVLVDKAEGRWAYGHSDYCAAAYVVDPEFTY